MTSTTKRMIPELTSVRAIAAFGVCMTHAAYWTGHYTDDWSGRLHGRWEIGVTIFFVLSAYLLVRPWLKATTDNPSLKRYFSHRVKRVLPGYWIAVCAAYFIHRDDVPPPLGSGFEGWIRNMTLTQSTEFGWFHPGLTQMWSLVVEVGFYLVLPLVGWLLLRMRRSSTSESTWPTWLIIIGFGLIGPIWTIVTHVGDTFPKIAQLWPMAYFDWFAVGMALAFAQLRGWRISPWVSWPIATVAFAVATTSMAGPATLVPEELGQALAKSILYAATAGFFLAPIVCRSGADNHERATAFLRHPVLVWLGEISYEFFLVHVMVLEWTMTEIGYQTFQGSMIAVLIVTTVISIPLSYVLRRVTDLITRR